MLKLYYSKGACSLIVRIIVNEMKLPCEFIAVNLKTKKTEDNGDFLKINPKGSVPVIVTADNKVLTENAVILQYLADKHQAVTLLPPVNDFSRYRVLEWLNFISTELHKGCAPLFNPDISEELKNNIFKPILKNKMSFVNNALEHNYLYSNKFTLPDAYLFVILSWLKHFDIPLDQWSNISRYFKTLNTLPSIIKSLAEENIKI